MSRIVHIGHGYWGRNIARNLSELGHLAGIVDADAKAVEAAAATYGVPAFSFNDALADDGIDAVSIASPAALHYFHAKAALQAGKHVLVEKPLALDVAEAQELCRIAEEANLILMVGHLLHYHPTYLKLRELVVAGELGLPLYVSSNRLSLGKFRREENVLWSFAPHDISMILGLTGEEPARITAQGCISWMEGIADMVTAQFAFPSGTHGHIQVSWMHPFKEHRLTVIGDKAMAVFEDSQPVWEDKLKLYRHEIDISSVVPLPTKVEPELIAVEKSEPLRNECVHFAECIESGRKARTDGREGVGVLRVLDAVEFALSENLTASARSARREAT